LSVTAVYEVFLIGMRMTTRQALLACLLFANLDGYMADLIAAEVPPRDAQQPNMVVVLVDDLRWDEIGCAGHPFVRTPLRDGAE